MVTKGWLNSRGAQGRALEPDGANVIGPAQAIPSVSPLVGVEMRKEKSKQFSLPLASVQTPTFFIGRKEVGKGGNEGGGKRGD